MTIPDLDPGTGHLPLGRHVCAISDVREHFVDHPRFASSTRRAGLFTRLGRYLLDWQYAQSLVGADDILRSIWIAGSFASGELDPDDIDVSPILDGPKLQEIKGRVGAGRIAELQGARRERMVKEYSVEPFPITWWPVTTLRRGDLSLVEHDYIGTRGLMDDVWQRTHSTGPKGAFTVDTAVPRRGYLEVVL
ncbi:DUF6932 family protein [Rhodococcus sp. P1Y]|uniref:DUF6932 family protein n=1 Tax=Rhodococcus sp. P1Y TaxID=1302308 RepID=UPI000EB14DC1|nr:hypothetical protein [Rhodococcus sp. P1Y]AYJ48803.1 hypothetical protein D8W71_11190 [Rhodococcus sp. P1Y]